MSNIANLNDRRSLASNGPRSSVRQSVRQSMLPAPRQSLMSTRESMMSARASILEPGRLSFISGRASLTPHSRISGAPMAAGRIKQMREARTMSESVKQTAKATGTRVPPYEFIELIGKGSFGRVFKSQKKGSSSLVALKIIEVDKSDYEAAVEHRESAIADFFTEISILQTLKDSDAKNINIIHEAFNFHSQLWIVSDYCPGGSVHTLMKASREPGIEEKYIVAIARELAIALKHIHDVGIIHRDVKAANVLITEHGHLQLCDFGVAGVLEGKAGKRHTMIGTPFWMAPEMYESDSNVTGYGSEVDCWAYGCTVYELATGAPPNFGINPQRLHLFLAQAPRLEGDKFSEPLKDFVAYCLVGNPAERPSAERLTKHPYVDGSNIEYPTSMLRELIERYAIWEQSGGERASLFNPNIGAQAPEALRGLADDDSGDEWNFSTTREFDDELDEKLYIADENELQQGQPGGLNDLTPAQRAELDTRARRGEYQMGRLFDPNARPYEYNPNYDEDEMPIRRDEEKARESVIDLDLDMDMDTDDSTIEPFETVRPNRMSNTPFFIDEDEDDEDDPYKQDHASQDNTKRSTMQWSFPGSNEHRKTMEWNFASAGPGNAEHRKTMEWKMDDASAGPAAEHRKTMEWKMDDALPAPAENRKTLEWSFGDANLTTVNESRKTLQWNFDNAGMMSPVIEGTRSAEESLLTSPQASVDLRPSARPQLKHTATAPPGDMPTATANPRDKADPRISTTIDLSIDEEPPNDVEIDPTYYSRPSTGYSSTVDSSFLSGTTSDNDDPFRYEESQTLRKAHVPALRAVAAADDPASAHRASLHAHSQSEPNRSSNPEFDPDYNYGSNRSSRARGASFRGPAAPLSAQLSRAPSVKASMDSLRLASDDDDDDLVPEPVSAPSLTFDTGTVKRSGTVPARLANGEDRAAKLRGRMRLRDAPPSPPPVLQRHRVEPFPDVAPVRPAALAEDAAQEEVVGEIQRLLAQMRGGLVVTGGLLGSVRKRSGSARRAEQVVPAASVR